MLVITRHSGQQIDIECGSHKGRILVLAIGTNGVVRLGFEAPPEFKFERPDRRNNKGEDMPVSAYAQVRFLKTFGTYCAYPDINGIEVPLVDYKKEVDAALAINHVYTLCGYPAPNEIPGNKLPTPERAEEIRRDVIERLAKRGIQVQETPPAPAPIAEKRYLITAEMLDYHGNHPAPILPPAPPVSESPSLLVSAPAPTPANQGELEDRIRVLRTELRERHADPEARQRLNGQIGALTAKLTKLKQGVAS